MFSCIVVAERPLYNSVHLKRVRNCRSLEDNHILVHTKFNIPNKNRDTVRLLLTKTRRHALGELFGLMQDVTLLLMGCNHISDFDCLLW